MYLCSVIKKTKTKKTDHVISMIKESNPTFKFVKLFFYYMLFDYVKLL